MDEFILCGQDVLLEVAFNRLFVGHSLVDWPPRSILTRSTVGEDHNLHEDSTLFDLSNFNRSLAPVG